MIFSLLVKPVSVKIIVKPQVMEAERNYSIVCEADGSHPRAKIDWLESNQPFRETQMSHVKVRNNFFSYQRLKEIQLIKKMISSQVGDRGVSRVQSTLTFSPLPEDHGKILKCLGRNPEIPNSDLEDSFHMNVVCKYSQYLLFDFANSFFQSPDIFKLRRLISERNYGTFNSAPTLDYQTLRCHICG